MWYGRWLKCGGPASALPLRTKILRYTFLRTSISIAFASKVDKLFTCQQRLPHYIQSPRLPDESSRFHQSSLGCVTYSTLHECSQQCRLSCINAPQVSLLQLRRIPRKTPNVQLKFELRTKAVIGSSRFGSSRGGPLRDPNLT